MSEVTKGRKRKSRLGHVLRHKPKRRKPPQDLLGRFGPYLSNRRKEQQLSIRQFARLAGLAHSNVFQFEELRKNPRLTELAQLAQAFEEPLTKFLEPVL